MASRPGEWVVLHQESFLLMQEDRIAHKDGFIAHKCTDIAQKEKFIAHKARFIATKCPDIVSLQCGSPGRKHHASRVKPSGWSRRCQNLRLSEGEAGSPKRQWRLVAREMPMRGPAQGFTRLPRMMPLSSPRRKAAP